MIFSLNSLHKNKNILQYNYNAIISLKKINDSFPIASKICKFLKILYYYFWSQHPIAVHTMHLVIRFPGYFHI